MTLVHWLGERLYWREDMPRRWVWLLVFAACQTMGSWTMGRLWAP